MTCTPHACLKPPFWFDFALVKETKKQPNLAFFENFKNYISDRVLSTAGMLQLKVPKAAGAAYLKKTKGRFSALHYVIIVPSINV